MIVVHKTNNHRVVGFAGALRYIGEDVIFWDSSLTPVFDMIKIKRPSTIIIEDDRLNNAITDAIQKHNIPTIIYGMFQSDNVVLNCISEKINPKLVRNIDESRVIPVRLATDYAKYKPNDVNVQKQGIYIRYPNQQITTEDFKTLLLFDDVKHNIRITCDTPVPNKYYIGPCSEKRNKDFVQQAKILIDFDNHLFDAGINKTIGIKNTDIDLQLIDNILTQDKLFKSLSKTAYKEAKNNTYFHQLIAASKILRNDWEFKCQAILQNI
jgi:hypothetical protein